MVEATVEDLDFTNRYSREPSNFKVIKMLKAHIILKELMKIKKLAEASAGFWM